MTDAEKLTKTVTPQVLEDFYNEKILPYLNGMGVNYSFTEQKTGRKWIDGKDIWQKTIDFGAFPNTTDKLVATGVSNIDKVIDMKGVYFGSTYSSILPYSGLVNDQNKQSTISLHYSISDNKIVVRTKMDYSSITSSYVTLFYTKTTG